MEIEKETVFTIGNFDGVHKGHRLLIDELKKLAKSVNNPNFGIIIFTPNTKAAFPTKYPGYSYLTNLKQKTLLLKGLDVPTLVNLDFNEVKNLTAKEFIENILIKKLNVKHLITGNNCFVGCDKVALKDAFKDNSYGINYKALSLYEDCGNVTSSGSIKELIKSGKVIEAKNLLGRSYEIEAEVIRGDGMASKMLNFPTANMVLNGYTKPLYGVYATKVFLNSKKMLYNSITNFGVRPTSKNNVEFLETHILDFKDDLYGEVISVRFEDFIRPEKKFNSFNELKDQIKQDIAVARNKFKETK